MWKKIQLEPVDFSKPIRSGLLRGNAEIIYSFLCLVASSVAIVSGWVRILSQGFPDTALRLVVIWGCSTLSLMPPGWLLCRHGMRLVRRRRHSEQKRANVLRDK